MTFAKQPILRAATLLLALASLTGCTGYRLGSMLPDDIRSVHVPSLRNTTTEPFLEAQATSALKREIQRDGSLALEEADRADAILEVIITSYTLNPIRYNRDDRTRPSGYRINMTANVTLRRRSTGEVIAHQPNVRGDTRFDFVTDLTTARRQALPAVSRDLAHDIVEMIVESW